MAQSSTLYLTDGESGLGATHMVQGGSEVGAFAWQNGGEIPIWVGNTVRQANYLGGGGEGAEYTLGGVSTGLANFWSNNGGAAYDAASDLSSVYIVDYPTGLVKSWGLNFDGAGSSLFQAREWDLGITYDGKRNEIWTTNFLDGILSEWTMGGTLVSQLQISAGEVAALAYDGADDTLWMMDNDNSQLVQVDPGSHTVLNRRYYMGYVLGGEMAATPEPATLAVLGIGLAATLRRRKVRSA